MPTPPRLPVASFCNDAKKRRRLAELVSVRPTAHVSNQRDALMLLGLMGYHRQAQRGAQCLRSRHTRCVCRLGLMVERVWGTRGLGAQDDPISAEEIR